MKIEQDYYDQILVIEWDNKEKQYIALESDHFKIRMNDLEDALKRAYEEGKKSILACLV